MKVETLPVPMSAVADAVETETYALVGLFDLLVIGNPRRSEELAVDVMLLVGPFLPDDPMEHLRRRVAS